MSHFQELLEEAAKQFPSKQAFARAIGITPSRFSKLLAGTYTLNVLNCLKLAKAAGISPSAVLRAAGKDKQQIADLIESMYGAQAEAVTREERALILDWRRLDEEDKAHLAHTMKVYQRHKRKVRRREQIA